MVASEGVVKFKQQYTKKPPVEFCNFNELNAWRTILYSTGLIGQRPDKYSGVGYGNISQRLEPCSRSRNNRNKFLITGTQTGGIEELAREHYATVLEYYPNRNEVVSEGPIKASSESMTHGAIYDLDDSINAVFHAHSRQIWTLASQLKIPTIKDEVEYGTPEMAYEVFKLFDETDVGSSRIFSMRGHEDGVFTFGKTSEEAGLVMLAYLARSLARQ
jgi:ribulose-5-phosphate 4-epimerase/fuculose-1-phosphate aldolase